jgi:hypothetical protein
VLYPLSYGGGACRDWSACVGGVVGGELLGLPVREAPGQVSGWPDVAARGTAGGAPVPAVPGRKSRTGIRGPAARRPGTPARAGQGRQRRYGQGGGPRRLRGVGGVRGGTGVQGAGEMSARFEEIDWRATPMGEISLRRGGVRGQAGRRVPHVEPVHGR